MVIICINGSINSGKSTIARLLAARLPDARFVEGDDHDGHELPFEHMIAHAVDRLATVVADADRTLVIAYPLREQDHAILSRAAASRGLQLLIVTLAPPLDVALSQRGPRILDDAERERIREMYLEGYHERPFSDLVIGGTPEPEVIVETIAALVRDGASALPPGSSAPAGG